MINLSLYDYLILILYAVILLLIGFLSKRKTDTSKVDFLLAGRNLNLPMFVMVTVATWYGGILGIGEFTYRYGINSWITQGLPYYIFAILFAFFFSKKVRATNLTTIPEKLEEIYGKRVSLISSIFIFMIVNPAPYALMTGVVFKVFFDLPMYVGIILGMFLSSVYLFFAGYRSNVFTDAYQFVLMFIGFGVLLLSSFIKLGSFQFLENNLDKEFLIPFKNISIGYFLVWFLIGLWTFVDPGFHQRSYAAKNEKVAFWGIIISVVFWFIFDFMTTTTGLFARAYLPNLENPVYSYLIFADRILPEALKGLFYASILATIISTFNSYTFLSAQTVGNDVLKKILKKNDEDVFLVRIGLLITVILSVLLAVLIPSIIDLWYTIGSIFIPGLLFPVVASYYEKFRLPERITFFQIISITFVTLIVFFIKHFELMRIEIEPMIAGILFGLVFQLLKKFFKEGK
ncbi:MAG: sodium:solute symporter family protein [Ignavibacteria bacterium]|nr:sodium:solute symporter family protein [Ignavibacteria bacterium]